MLIRAATSKERTLLSKYSHLLKLGGIAGLLTVGLFAIGAMATVNADTPDPTTGDTARLLGYLWADGSFSDGVWDATAPSGGAPLIGELVERHGGEWVDRQQLQFRLPAPYDWVDWKDGLPDDDAVVRNAVQHPHFLAALLEGEGSVGGLVYDQSSCCTPGFTQGRLTSLRDLLQRQGYRTATIEQFGDVDSGRVMIDPAEFAALRSTHLFVCPTQQGFIRVPGGDNFVEFGNLQWLGSGTEWSDVVRTDCVEGQPIDVATAPVGTCTATVEGDEVTVSWSHEIGTISLRRNDVFRRFAPASAGSVADIPGDGTFAYSVLLRVFDDTTVAECGTVVVGGEALEIEPAPTPAPPLQAAPTDQEAAATPVVEAEQPVEGVVGDPVPEVPETTTAPQIVAQEPTVQSTCRVQAAGDSAVQLQWSDKDASRYHVRRNGSWVGAYGDALEAIRPGTLGDSWEIRLFERGEIIDIACGVDETPATIACQQVVEEDGVTLSWEAIEGVDRYHVRQGQRWIAATAGAEFFYAGATELTGFDIRYRLDGMVVTLACVP